MGVDRMETIAVIIVEHISRRLEYSSTIFDEYVNGLPENNVIIIAVVFTII